MLCLFVGKRQRSKDISACDRHCWVNRFIPNGCACWRGSGPLLLIQRLLPALGRPVALGKQKSLGRGVIPNYEVLQSNDTHFKSNWKEMVSGVINSFLSSKVYLSTENYICSSWAGKGSVGMRWSQIPHLNRNHEVIWVTPLSNKARQHQWKIPSLLKICLLLHQFLLMTQTILMSSGHIY